jgi:predicted MFS family arabinose efflux permease
MVPENERGLASGWMAAMTQAGNIAGALGALLLPWGNQAAAAYVLIGGSLALFAGITLVGMRERTDLPPPPPVDWAAFVRGLWIDPRKHPDFAWVWITRALFVMGIISVQQYLQYYLTDVLHVARSETDKLAAVALLIGMIGATVTGLIGGAISDRVGRKVVVYVANASIAATVVLFLFAPNVSAVYVIAAVFGLGYGAYYSVDWALGVDVLPDQDNPAKDMAVWHIAFVLPQSVALPLAGFLLSTVGHTARPGSYSYAGYAAIFGMAATFLILGAVLLRNVRGVR